MEPKLKRCPHYNVHSHGCTSWGKVKDDDDPWQEYPKYRPGKEAFYQVCVIVGDKKPVKVVGEMYYGFDHGNGLPGLCAEGFYDKGTIRNDVIAFKHLSEPPKDIQ